MGSPQEELAIFGQFVRALPNFADRPITFGPGTDPPDILCKDSSGFLIGVELTEWLNKQQIARERPRYQAEWHFLQIIDSRREEPLQNIGRLWIFRHENVRVERHEMTAFRQQLFSFLNDLDRQWPSVEHHDNPQGAWVRNLSGQPLVSKYLRSMLVWSQNRSPAHLGSEWITFMNHGGSCSTSPALSALEAALLRKTTKYASLHSKDLREVYLLIYYHRGHLYNTPFDGPNFGFPEAVAHLRALATNDRGQFDRIFLFVPATESVACVYP